MENINKPTSKTDKEIIHTLEQTSIQKLITKSITENTVYEYKNKIDLHYQLKNNPYYELKYLQKLDLTYINIRAETILMDKHNIIIKKTHKKTKRKKR